MMLIHEVCKKCNLTKKAIEYYGEQGLISPAVTENGYRQFSDDDVEKLKKIAVMRGLGLSVADIRVVLKDNSQSALLPMLHKKELEIATMKEKQEIMQRLVNSGDWEAVQLQMEALQSRQMIRSNSILIAKNRYTKKRGARWPSLAAASRAFLFRWIHSALFSIFRPQCGQYAPFISRLLPQ